MFTNASPWRLVLLLTSFCFFVSIIATIFEWQQNCEMSMTDYFYFRFAKITMQQNYVYNSLWKSLFSLICSINCKFMKKSITFKTSCTNNCFKRWNYQHGPNVQASVRKLPGSPTLVPGNVSCLITKPLPLLFNVPEKTANLNLVPAIVAIKG